MRQVVFSVVFMAFAMLSPHSAQATHAQGMDLTYSCLGGDTFALTLHFYRDCDGVNAPGIGGTALPSVDISSASCSQNFTSNMQLVFSQEIGVICASLNTTCNNGPYPGVEEYIYVDTVVMPAACTDWIFSYNLCCRNNAISTINPTNVDIYVETMLNNVSAPCNSSPIFASTPVPFVCIGSPYCFNNAAIDPDGDSLVYSLVTPTTGPGVGDTVNYTGTFSGTAPLSSSTPITFDSTNGEICLTPTSFEVSVMQVRVEEWRNGVLVGSLDRDIQLRVTNCIVPNVLPVVNGIDGSGVFNVSICAGDSFCFTTNTVDPDAGQSVTMTWNSGIPDATFNISNDSLPTGSFCWLSDSSDINVIPHCFTVTVEDDNCPFVGTQTFTFCITVTGFINANLSALNPACSGDCNGSIAANVANGIAPYTYAWSSGQSTSSLTALCPGTYTVTITDSVGCAPVRTAVLIDPTVLAAAIGNPTGIPCFGQLTGSATVSATGGTAPYSYLWNPATGNQTTATAAVLPAGTYTVTVTDNRGCDTLLAIAITEPPLLTATTQLIQAVSCAGGTDGLAVVTASGGVPPYSYSWDAAASGQSTDTAFSLTAGTYSVTVADNNGCDTVVSINIPEPSLLGASISSLTNVFCFGGANGQLTVGASGGTSPYSFQWGINAANATTAAVTGLSAGSYQVTVTDSLGCDSVVNATLSEPPLLGLTSTLVQDVSCFAGNDGALTVAASGGSGTYTYQWTNGANSAGLTGLLAGTFSVTVTDSLGCDSLLTLVVTEPSLLGLSQDSLRNISCNGGNDGALRVAGSGGTPPYSFQWGANAGFSTSALVTNLVAGIYGVTVTDSLGCDSAITLSLIEPSVLVATSSSVNSVSCFGLSNGQAIVQAIGGSPAYTFQWDTSAGNQTTDTAYNLAAGLYSVTVTDTLGCDTVSTVSISEPPQLNLSLAASSNVSCFNGMDGTATVLPTGGSAPYTFLWDSAAGNQNQVNVTGLAAGNYQVTVSDSLGCDTTLSVLLSEPTLLGLNMDSLQHISCFNGTDGSAAVIASGGTTPYTYQWDANTGNQSGPEATGLTAGNYFVTVTDSLGCDSVLSITLNEPSVLSLSIDSISDVLCFGEASGYLTAVAGGGTAPYSYQWDANANNQSGILADSLAIGMYLVTVTDSLGCTDTSSATVNQPAPLSTITSILNHVSCTLGSDGSATSVAGGGVVPYAFQWDTNAGSQAMATATGLSIGTYLVTVTDSNGCEASDSVSVTEPSLLTLQSGNITDVSCFAGSDGGATVIPGGGTLPYTFQWDSASGGLVSAGVNGLSAGNYSVTLTDSNGCDTTITVSVSQPGLLSPQVDSLQNISCFGGANGQITISALGGTQPYTYQWDANTGNQSGPTASSLAAGTYSVTITDSLGCDSTLSILLLEPGILTANPGPVSNVGCFGVGTGIASVLATSGTPPYSYLWDSAAGLQVSSVAGGLFAGNYQVTVTDSLGCVATTSLSISEPPALGLTITAIDHVDCAFGSDGAATAVASGGTPTYTFLWDVNTNNQTTATATGLYAGTYHITLTDSNGCDAIDSLTILEPPVLDASIGPFNNISCFGGADGQATVVPTGGVVPYSYLWDAAAGNQNTPLANGLIAGTYWVTVTDSNGCDTLTSVTLSEPSLLVPNAFALANVSCFGGNDGFALATANGGTMPFSFQWDSSTGSQSVDSAQNLSAGTFSVTITDTLGCDTNISITITEPNLLTGNFPTTTNISCFGGSDGQATVSGSGGTPGYAYQWGLATGNQTGTNAVNLIAGSYFVTVTDTLGCDTVLSIALTQPQALTAQITGSEDVSCFGGNDGSAWVVGSGGSQPYAILWGTSTGSQVTDTASNLPVGHHFVALTDSLGCTSNDSVLLNSPSALSLGLSANSVSCFGGNDGQVLSAVSGGTAPYTFQWSGQAGMAPGPQVNGLPVGTYSLLVTDFQGCEILDSVAVTEPSAIAFSTVPDTVMCVGLSYPISAQASGGNGIYSYSWNQGLGSGSSHSVSPVQSTVYVVTVSDSVGCTGGIDSVVVQVKNLSNDTLQLTSSGDICLGDSASLTAFHNGTIGPYTYSWPELSVSNPGPVKVSPEVTSTYYFTVHDDCGQSLQDSVQVVVHAMQVELPDTIAQGCPPLEVSFSDTTNIGQMTYLWSFGDGNSSSDPSPTHQYQLAGIYPVNVTVISVQGCTASTANTSFVKVNVPPVADFTMDPPEASIQNPTIIFYDQSTGAVNRFWDFGDGVTDQGVNPVHSYQEVGTYTVNYRVEDRFGCENELEKPITITPYYTLDIPNAFTPNPNAAGNGSYDPNDLTNDVFFPFTQYVDEYHLLVFNRWGEIVFESFDVAVGWDGYYRGELCQQDVYAYRVTLRWIDGIEKTVVGDVTLIR